MMYPARDNSDGTYRGEDEETLVTTTHAELAEPLTR